MKYENKRNGRIVELIDTPDEKYNTVFLRDVETGKEQTVTVSTLKRWYKKVEESVAEPVDCSPCPANEETPVPVYVDNEPGKEVDTVVFSTGQELVVDCTPGMEVDAPDAEHYRPAAEYYLEAIGYEVKADKSMPSRTIVRRDGKTCAELYFGKRALKVNVRKDRADELETLGKQYTAPGIYFKVINNYYLPVTLGNIPYTNTAVVLDVFGA